jgi:hypothetical protein
LVAKWVFSETRSAWCPGVEQNSWNLILSLTMTGRWLSPENHENQWGHTSSDEK